MNKLFTFLVSSFLLILSCRPEPISSGDILLEERASGCACSAAINTNSLSCPVTRSGFGGLSVRGMVVWKGWDVCTPAVATGMACVSWKYTSGTLQFESPASMAQILGITDANQSAVTIIATSNQTHAVIQKGGMDGFHPLDNYNGTSVSASILSEGVSALDSWVKAELNTYQEKNPAASDREANTWIQCKLIPAIKKHVQDAASANVKINTHFSTLPHKEL